MRTWREEDGLTPTDQGVWTGSSTSGGVTANPLGDVVNTTFGLAFAVDADWINGSFTTPTLSVFHYYAMSGTLTVVPEPGTGMLLTAGLLALAYRQRRSIH